LSSFFFFIFYFFLLDGETTRDAAEPRKAPVPPGARTLFPAGSCAGEFTGCGIGPQRARVTRKRAGFANSRAKGSSPNSLARFLGRGGAPQRLLARESKVFRE